MSLYPRFFRNLDQSAGRAILVSLALFALVIGIFIVGKTGSVVDVDSVQEAIRAYADSPMGPALLIAFFCLAAFIGIPQFALIAAAAIAFGPWGGAGWSWVATMISGAITFWLGRLLGEETFRKYAGQRANRFSSFLGRNAFAASFMVRSVPAGPFLVVNMAFGVSHSKFLAFWGGMALGIIPKIALVAFLGQSVAAAVKGNPLVAILAGGAAIGLWIAVMLYARSRRQNNPLIEPDPVDISAGTAE